MKRCPFCAEEIQDTAVVCRFCNRDLDPRSAATDSADPPTQRSKGFYAAEGEQERFIVVEFPDKPKSPGHVMTTSRPMTEPEFREWLTGIGLAPVTVEEMVAGARSTPIK